MTVLSPKIANGGFIANEGYAYSEYAPTTMTKRFRRPRESLKSFHMSDITSHSLNKAATSSTLSLMEFENMRIKLKAKKRRAQNRALRTMAYTRSLYNAHANCDSSDGKDTHRHDLALEADIVSRKANLMSDITSTQYTEFLSTIPIIYKQLYQTYQVDEESDVEELT